VSRFIFPFSSSKDAQPGNLVSEIVSVEFSVCVSHAEQNQQTAADLADGLFGNRDLGTTEPLYDSAHGIFLALIAEFPGRSITIITPERIGYSAGTSDALAQTPISRESQPAPSPERATAPHRPR
jgi:hypothetical protein